MSNKVNLDGIHYCNQYTKQDLTFINLDPRTKSPEIKGEPIT